MASLKVIVSLCLIAHCCDAGFCRSPLGLACAVQLPFQLLHSSLNILKLSRRSGE